MQSKQWSEEGAMDHFEQDLARRMRDSRQRTPYEDRHRHRLRAAVRARMATGSAPVIDSHGVGLMALSSSFAHEGTAPEPRPGITAEPAPGASVVRPASTAQEGSTSTVTSTTPPLPVPYRLTTSGRPTT